MREATVTTWTANEKWDRRMLGLAAFVAAWSKDPSTQTGAVVCSPDYSVVSVGYNGLPRGVVDTPERLVDRDVKLQMTVHCEVNAVLSAHRDLRGYQLFTWPFMSCARCAAVMIQAGIRRCVAPVISPALAERWGAECALARQMYREAGVVLLEVRGAEPPRADGYIWSGDPTDTAPEQGGSAVTPSELSVT